MRNYRFTPGRRRALKIAQRKSAISRKKSGIRHTKGKQHLGYWVAKGVNKLAGTVTFGVGPALANVLEGKKRSRARQTYRWRK